MANKKPLRREEGSSRINMGPFAIYESNEGFEKDLNLLNHKNSSSNRCKDTALKDGESLLAFLNLLNVVDDKIETAYVYSHLKADKMLTMKAKFKSTCVLNIYQFSGASAWFAPAILALSDEEFESSTNKNRIRENFRVLLEAARIKGHVLSR